MDTMPEPRDAADALAEIHRAEWGRIVGGLARRFGDLDLAEEVAADAFAVAVERWAADGVPPNPGAWITTTAHRRAIDRLRREARRDDKHREALLIADDSPAEEVGAVADDRLRLGFLTEAVRLARELHVLLPDDGDVTGLLALLLASAARIPARLAPDGALVTLSEQNRDAWDRAMISEADALIAERQRIARATGIRLGRFELLAAVHLVHARAPDAGSTDWSQIVTLYEMLERVDPSPIVGVNHAIAVAEADSPEAGLAVLERHDDTLAGHYAFHAVRAHLRAAGGETAEALRAYDRAISLAPSPEMAELLAARRRNLAHNSSH